MIHDFRVVDVIVHHVPLRQMEIGRTQRKHRRVGGRYYICCCYINIQTIHTYYQIYYI
jgi:hypothetical protein